MKHELWDIENKLIIVFIWKYYKAGRNQDVHWYRICLAGYTLGSTFELRTATLLNLIASLEVYKMW